MNLKITLVLILFLSLKINSQNFIEKQLPEPNKLSTFFIGPLLKSTIHYGKKPNNFNGEVLLFNHGYIDLNQLFFTNNTFYSDAYNAGYQVAFVATTRGKGMWVNGELLAESIDIITHKYNVNNLTIIAHSNGGKATEVAMYTHNKSNKVKKAIALGTPFWGTYLADISQKWWFNWIWSKTGLNEGSATSTTYYCEDVVRPYFDNLPNNEPEKFFILGASGFNRGHTILAPAMFTSGSILYVNQGTNDGVTPYSSSLRPNGNYVFKKGEAKLDHVDVALGQYVWKHIYPILKGTYSKSTSQNKNLNHKNTISSNYQIINSENSYDKILNATNKTSLKIEVLHDKSNKKFRLYSNNKKLNKVVLLKGSDKTPDFQSTYIIKNTQELTSIKGNSRFAAFVYHSDGPVMNLHKENKRSVISFDNISTDLEKIEVDAVITKTTDILGNTLTENNSFIYTFSFDAATKTFSLDTSGFDNGTYSMYITGKDKKFIRSIISGFAVGNLSSEIIDENITNTRPNLTLELQSNQITEKIVLINNDTNFNEKIVATIYNLNGQEQIKETLQNSNGTYILQNKVSSLTQGLYILSIETNNLKKTYKILKK